MDRDTLRTHIDGVVAAVAALEHLMAEVHDLGGVGFPHTKVSCLCEINEGFSFCHTPTPILHVTWPSTPHASAHRTLAVESLRSRWNTESAKLARAVVGSLERTLDALFENGLPAGTAQAHYCTMELHIGAHTEVFIGWDPTSSSSLLMGLTGMGLHPTRNTDTIVDLLSHAARLTQSHTSEDGTLWKLRGVVAYAYNPDEHVTDDNQVRAVDASDAVLRTALSGSNALLCRDRLFSLDVWQHHTTPKDTILDAIALRNTL